MMTEQNKLIIKMTVAALILILVGTIAALEVVKCNAFLSVFHSASINQCLFWEGFN
jgi:hypothetical protein